MIQIIKNRKISFTISAIAFLSSVLILFIYGLKPGIDFTGGTLIELSFTQERPALEDMQTAVDTLDLGAVTVQPVDEDGYLLKLRFISEDEHQALLSSLRETFTVSGEAAAESDEAPAVGGLTITDQDGNAVDSGILGITTSADGADRPAVLEERIETIGPSISSELTRKSWQAGIAVILAIVFFVAYAFRKVTKPVASWKYGITAIIALVHDVTITMGVFALLGHFYGIEIGIPFVVAMLTILGYSVNDTIVVFDRIREKLIKDGRNHFAKTVNAGVNETIPRSINTSITTLLVLFALFIFGGGSIHYFALALIIGIALGTYSSIFLASPLLVVWKNLQERK